jgi:Protein of unknown function (DUF2281)
MTAEEVIFAKVKVFPPNLKEEALHYVEYLETKIQPITPRVSLEGIWADMNVNVTEEDIREMRNEAWKNFPREHFFENEENK